MGPAGQDQLEKTGSQKIEDVAASRKRMIADHIGEGEG
jgi:hypothetical protein